MLLSKYLNGILLKKMRFKITLEDKLGHYHEDTVIANHKYEAQKNVARDNPSLAIVDSQ